LSAEKLRAVQEAVETGDADKLPVGFSKSCSKRRKPFIPEPKAHSASCTNPMDSEMSVKVENVTESAEVELESSPGSLIKSEPVDEELSLECQGLQSIGFYLKIEEIHNSAIEIAANDQEIESADGRN
jgi:hypothetical protein